MMLRRAMADMVRLIKAVEKVGPRNAALIARITGLPERTVRYWIKVKLPSLGFVFRPVVDESRLGLVKHLMRIRFRDDLGHAALSVLDVLGKGAYLTYYAGLMPHDEFIALVDLPVSVEDEYKSLFHELVNAGVLDSYELYPLDEVWKTSTDVRYFDFNRGTWALDIVVPDEEVEVGARTTVIRRADCEEPSLDKIDLLIVKELQKDPLQPFTQMAETLGVDEATLRYHYREHVLKGIISGYVVKWHPMGSLLRGDSVGLVLLSEVDEDMFARISNILAKIPFNRFEGISIEHALYVLIMEIPTSWLVGTLRLIRDARLPLGVEFTFIDGLRIRRFTIPYELYDDKIGWTFDKRSVYDGIDRALSLA
ncbi:MAG: hypothetical protein DRJ43_05235 [Thermoprotei archaeon]|nr:MAG: hypothetical protein DRJ43_05235 [Thermoprotei archaeon]